MSKLVMELFQVLSSYCLLDLHKMNIETIPSSIGKLWHLSYLDLSNNPIEMLPNSITRLHNLQTLRIFECPIKQLPKYIDKLVNFKYLEMNKCWHLTHMPCGLGQLTKLQILSKFVMSQNSCLDFRCHGGLKELNRLNKLRGTLKMKGVFGFIFFLSLNFHYSSLITQFFTLVWHHHPISITQYFSPYLWANTCPSVQLFLLFLFFFFSVPKLTEA